MLLPLQGEKIDEQKLESLGAVDSYTGRRVVSYFVHWISCVFLVISPLNAELDV